MSYGVHERRNVLYGQTFDLMYAVAALQQLVTAPETSVTRSTFTAAEILCEASHTETWSFPFPISQVPLAAAPRAYPALLRA